MAVWVSTDFKLGKTIDNCTVEQHCDGWSGAEPEKGDFFVIRGVILPQLLSREFHRFQVGKKSAKVRMFSKQQSFGVYRTGPGQGLQFRVGAIICPV